MVAAALSQRRLVIIAAIILCLELGAIEIVYQIFATLDCPDTNSEGLCLVFRRLVARAISVLAALTIFWWARPKSFSFLVAARDRGAVESPWFWVHLAGVALILAPIFWAEGRDTAEFFRIATGPWLAGAVLASLGALFWLAPAREWLAWLREERFVPLLLAGFAFLFPDLAALAQPVWNWSLLTDATFGAVASVLELAGAAPYVEPAEYLIGLNGFLVAVGRPCSGVEGFVLICGYGLLHAAIFRHELRVGPFLLLIAGGLILSWLFNVLRIAVLVWIGAHYSPQLAANGFHSYAGWLFFTLIALSLLCVAHSAAFVRTGGQQVAVQSPPPLLEDWNAARILPFAAVMLASLIASTFFTEPNFAYPLKAAAMAAALGLFLGVYRRLDWSPDPVAAGAGILVGLAWIGSAGIMGAAAPIPASAVEDLGAAAFAVWIAVRVIGAVILTPMVEELFFRGYLLSRLDLGGTAGRVVAIAVSSALFALLHGRWIEAGLAGVVFALVMLRRGRLADAVIAHAAANAVVAADALLRGDWYGI